MQKATHHKQRLGDRLVEAGKISREDLDRLLKKQQESGCYLGRLLIEDGYVTEEELNAFLPEDVAKQRLMTVNERRSVDLGEFFRLQTALKFTLFSDEPIRTLLVTSALPGEGKTLCASYLARAVATVQQGRCLLLDADLCNPTLHTRNDVPLRPGWTDYLVNTHALDSCFADTDIENLKIMPAGTVPPNPAALFASRKMREFVDELKTIFELVVFDSSPLLPVSATAILGAHLDAAIMVVKAGATKRKLVKKAVGLLNESKTNIIGVVLNQTAGYEVSKYAYGYGYGYSKKRG